uniref:Uncharacterized protein n=1 Tax=Anguilla anguilla TaxID=7936 RepID=A0A0E9SSH6_ANGAN
MCATSVNVFSIKKQNRYTILTCLFNASQTILIHIQILGTTVDS